MSQQEFGLNTGGVLRVSRKEIVSNDGKEFTDPSEIALWKCLQRLAKLSVVEGLALSRIKGYSGGLYSTIICKEMIPNAPETRHFFEETAQAFGDFGDAIGKILPGSVMRLPEGRAFYKAARSLRGKRRANELELLGIIHFVK